LGRTRKTKAIAGARPIVLLALAALMLAGACGSGQKVGSEKLLEFEEQKGAKRLGEATETPPPVQASGAPLAVGAPTPKPTPAPTPTPAPRFFDVTLVADSPFYEPGNALIMVAGATLRVTNKDTTPEREARSFTDADGSFDSGMLKPGQSWTMRFDKTARFRVKDRGLPFASATFEVRTV
jgi:hypothetical protein